MTNDQAIVNAARRYVRAARRIADEHGRAIDSLIEHSYAWAALTAAIERPCWICEDGYSLEADGVCDRCGRNGSCPRCAEGDCPHLIDDEPGDGPPGKGDNPDGRAVEVADRSRRPDPTLDA